MEFRILGPLEVRDGDREVPLGGPRQRAVLAILLTRAGEVVSQDRLIDELWGEEPPQTATNTLHGYLSHLREAVGRDVIESRAPGYVLRLEPGQLDLRRFERLAEQAARALGAGRAGEAAATLREALSLWRGPALADFAYEPFAQAEIARLEELRLGALERRLEADLALGRHGELVGELEALVAEHPLRERLRAQLMLALYRSGRQAEALAAYRDARQALVDELGIEPGPALQELERAILCQDPGLEPERAPAGDASPRRAILVVTGDASSLDALLSLAGPLARRPDRELVVACLVPDEGQLAPTAAALSQRRAGTAANGVQTRVAAYTSAARGDETVLLATELDADLLLVDAPRALLEEGVPDLDLAAVLAAAPCDVGVLVGGPLPADGARPVVVPFGGAQHDWSAVEIAAWAARSLGTDLRLVGTVAQRLRGRRDASRLLARASLVVQAAVGVVAEPVLVRTGAEGLLGVAGDACLLVVALSERWRAEGLGPARLAVARGAPVPTLLVRSGLRPGGLAPRESLTRFTWTIAGG